MAGPQPPRLDAVQDSSSPPAVSSAAVPLTQPMARYVHARRVGDLLFLAGQGSRDAVSDQYAGLVLDREGKVLSYDIRAQSRAVLANVEAALKAHGLDRAAIVDVQVFLADMADFSGMNEVWNAFFKDVPTPPTRTTVAVRQLPGKNFVEMKAIAAYTTSSPMA